MSGALTLPVELRWAAPTYGGGWGARNGGVDGSTGGGDAGGGCQGGSQVLRQWLTYRCRLAWGTRAEMWTCIRDTLQSSESEAGLAG